MKITDLCDKFIITKKSNSMGYQRTGFLKTAK